MGKVISFEQAVDKYYLKQEEERLLWEIYQRQKEKIHYNIGNVPSSDISLDDYVSYLVSDIDSDARSYFRSRWYSFLSKLNIAVSDIIEECKIV